MKKSMRFLTSPLENISEKKAETGRKIGSKEVGIKSNCLKK